MNRQNFIRNKWSISSTFAYEHLWGEVSFNNNAKMKYRFPTWCSTGCCAIFYLSFSFGVHILLRLLHTPLNLFMCVFIILTIIIIVVIIIIACSSWYCALFFSAVEMLEYLFFLVSVTWSSPLYIIKDECLVMWMVSHPSSMLYSVEVQVPSKTSLFNPRKRCKHRGSYWTNSSVGRSWRTEFLDRYGRAMRKEELARNAWRA